MGQDDLFFLWLLTAYITVFFLFKLGGYTLHYTLMHLKAVPDPIHFDITRGSAKANLNPDNMLKNADKNRRNLQQQKINSLFAEIS